MIYRNQMTNWRLSTRRGFELDWEKPEEALENISLLYVFVGEVWNELRTLPTSNIAQAFECKSETSVPRDV